MQGLSPEPKPHQKVKINKTQQKELERQSSTVENNPGECGILGLSEERLFRKKKKKGIINSVNAANRSS